MNIGSHPINFHGWLPDQYLTNDKLFDGLMKLMSIVGIRPGWKTGAGTGQGEDWLLELAMERLGYVNTTAVAPPRKRRAKA